MVTNIKKVLFYIFLLITAANLQAQSDCEKMLNSAIKDYYNKGKYAQALKMFQQVQTDCGDNYGGASTYIKKCKYKLQEDKDYKKCSTIEACDDYLETYPNGRYVSKVQQKRTTLVSEAEEDEAYAMCATTDACLTYLKNYPDGRYVDQVNEKMLELEEERIRREEDEAYSTCTSETACLAYLNRFPEGRYEILVKKKLNELKEDAAYALCTTEVACDSYLKSYPNGRYWDDVMEKKSKMIEERVRKELEAKKTAYMKIRKIEFANVDKDDKIINSYGSILYISDIKYLKPKIFYDGILGESKSVTLYSKIIKPNGEVMEGENPGYTFSNTFLVNTGAYNTHQLSGWGNSQGGSYSAGEYMFELWYEGNRIFQTSFTLKEKENALSRGTWKTALTKCNEYVTEKYDNGSYKGQLVDGSRQGLGMYVWNDGTCYIGRWKSGNREGTGIYIVPSGYHVKNCSDCIYYVGDWANGDKSGNGTCYDKMGKLIYYGNFVDNSPSQTYPTVGYDNYKFECLVYTNGNYYLGETKNGKPHGAGVYIWSNGAMWYGNWNDGERDGYGIYMSNEGSFSTGTWKGDSKQ